MFGSLPTTKEWFGRKRDLRIRQSNFILSVQNYIFSFISLRDWFRKLVPASQPIRYKTNTDRIFDTHVFPRFKQLTRFKMYLHFTVFVSILLWF